MAFYIITIEGGNSQGRGGEERGMSSLLATQQVSSLSAVSARVSVGALWMGELIQHDNKMAADMTEACRLYVNPIICWISWTFPSQRTSLPFYLKTFSTLHILYNESIQRSMILRSRIPGFETGTASSEACNNKPLSISPVFTKRSPTILTIFQDL